MEGHGACFHLWSLPGVPFSLQYPPLHPRFPGSRSSMGGRVPKATEVRRLQFALLPGVCVGCPLAHVCPRRLAPSAHSQQLRLLFRLVGSRSIYEAQSGAGPCNTQCGGRGELPGTRPVAREGLGRWAWGQCAQGSWRGKGRQETTLGQPRVSKPCLPCTWPFLYLPRQCSASAPEPGDGVEQGRAESGFSTRHLAVCQVLHLGAWDSLF